MCKSGRLKQCSNAMQCRWVASLIVDAEASSGGHRSSHRGSRSILNTTLSGADIARADSKPWSCASVCRSFVGCAIRLAGVVNECESDGYSLQEV